MRSSVEVFARVLHAAGRPDDDRTRIEATLLLAQIERFYDYWIIWNFDFDRELVVNLLTDIWHRELNAPPVAEPKNVRTLRASRSSTKRTPP
jgi:hypothetical protein